MECQLKPWVQRNKCTSCVIFLISVYKRGSWLAYLSLRPKYLGVEGARKDCKDPKRLRKPTYLERIDCCCIATQNLMRNAPEASKFSCVELAGSFSRKFREGTHLITPHAHGEKDRHSFSTGTMYIRVNRKDRSGQIVVIVPSLAQINKAVVLWHNNLTHCKVTKTTQVGVILDTLC